MIPFDLGALRCELYLLTLAVVVFLVDLTTPEGRSRRVLGYITALGLLFILSLSLFSPAANSSVCGDMFLNDGLARVFKIIFLASAFLTVLGCHDYLVESGIRWQGEFYFILLMVTLGMNFIASAGNFLSLYVALEFNTIGFYVLVSMLKGKSIVSSETGLKYLILGALSSAVLLYGISLLYGASGSLSLQLISQYAKTAPSSPLLGAAVALVLIGLAFKVTLVPFHAWSPDVYQGAPTPVTAFLSVASKAAGFAAIVRVLLWSFQSWSPLWIELMTVLAVLTFILSNVVALKQSNIKRLLAYSSVGQAGYLVIAVIAENGSQSHLGLYSLVFYLMVYVVTNIAAFTVAMRVAADSGNDDIDGFKGLAQRSPTLALVMMMSMFSLAGIPPFGGFFGKFYIFMAGMEAHYAVLVTFAVLMSIISLYYYLVVVKRMYLENPIKSTPISSGLGVRLCLGVCGVLIIAMGVYPAPFLSWIKAALQLG
jgi:NADH-quinone oxidoreductase subunit N